MSDADRIRRWMEDCSAAVQAIDCDAVARAVGAIRDVRAAGKTIFVAGNGGSAFTASHLALDLQKAVRPDGRGTRAIALSDSVGLITAWANDVAFDRVFAEQLSVLAGHGDALVIFSVSGSSPNLVAVLEMARERGVVSVGILGGDGGRARALVDHAVLVPSADYGWVETAHLLLEHVISYALRGGAMSLGARG